MVRNKVPLRVAIKQNVGEILPKCCLYSLTSENYNLTGLGRDSGDIE